MAKHTQGRVASQVRSVRRRAVEDRDLCFSKLLPREQVEAAIGRHQIRYREQLYTPLVTILAFLSQPGANRYQGLILAVMKT